MIRFAAILNRGLLARSRVEVGSAHYSNIGMQIPKRIRVQLITCLVIAVASLESLAVTLYRVNPTDIPHTTFVEGARPPTGEHYISQFKLSRTVGGVQELVDYNIYVAVRKNIQADPPKHWIPVSMTPAKFQSNVVSLLEEVAEDPEMFRLLNKFKHNKKTGDKNFALYISEMSSDPFFEPKDLEHTSGYVSPEEAYAHRSGRGGLALDSPPGEGTSINMALRGDIEFFSEWRGEAMRTFMEELVQAHRAAWGASPPIETLENFVAKIDDIELLPLGILLEELEASADLPSPIIIDPSDGRPALLNYRSPLATFVERARERGEYLGDFSEAVGYIDESADRWMMSIYVKDGDSLLPISLFDDRKAVSNFLEGKSLERIARYKEQFEQLHRWAMLLQKSADDSPGRVSRQVLGRFSRYTLHATFITESIRASKSNCG